MSARLDLARPLECETVGEPRPARLLAADIRGKFPVACAIDLGSREEVHLFTVDGEGESELYRVRNR